MLPILVTTAFLLPTAAAWAWLFHCIHKADRNDQRPAVSPARTTDFPFEGFCDIAGLLRALDNWPGLSEADIARFRADLERRQHRQH